MAATVSAPSTTGKPVPQISARQVRRQPTGWTSWFTTTDHKRIGIMYLVLTFAFWMLAAGGLVFYGSLFFSPPECGWTCYAPLNQTQYLPSHGVDAWIFLIHLTGISSLIGAINLYATIVNMRAPGMGWGRLPLFVW